MSNDGPPYQVEQFSASEVTRAVNTLAQVFNELEFTKGTRGMAYIMMFVVFQHRVSGHTMDLMVEQLKSTWAMFDQLDKGLSDRDMSKDN